MKAARMARRAFSLVEVTLALGVCAFCLLAVTGLLVRGISDSQSANNQTISNGLLSTVIADLQAAQPANGADVESPIYQIRIPSNTSTQRDPIIRYMTADGTVSSQMNADSIYRLTITFLPADNTKARGASMALVRASWPPSTDVKNALGSVDNFIALDRN